MNLQFLTEEQAGELLQVSDRTLQRYRKDNTHLLGVHYQKLPGGGIRYIQPVLEDWMVNLHDPEAHQRAIEEFRKNLLSNRKRKGSHST